MARGLHLTRFAAVLLCVLAVGAAASARNETLRWQQPANTAAFTGFKVYWSASSGTSGSMDAQLPTPDGQGVYSSTVSGVPDLDDVTFRMTAYNAAVSPAVESSPSNSICRGPGGAACGTSSGGTSGGGTSTGGGTSATSQSAILGFKLWDASSAGTDTVLDANFTSGKTINNSCTAIEIIGNDYLNAGSGSVLKQFDNSSTVCENNPQFGWEDGGSAGQFACANSLTVAGAHTLVVTPYDGKNCGGTAGSSVSLSFSVNVSSTPPPAAGSLGVPGKPYLVTQ